MSKSTFVDEFGDEDSVDWIEGKGIISVQGPN